MSFVQAKMTAFTKYFQERIKSKSKGKHVSVPRKDETTVPTKIGKDTDTSNPDELLQCSVDSVDQNRESHMTGDKRTFEGTEEISKKMRSASNKDNCELSDTGKESELLEDRLLKKQKEHNKHEDKYTGSESRESANVSACQELQQSAGTSTEKNGTDADAEANQRISPADTWTKALPSKYLREPQDSEEVNATTDQVCEQR